MTLSMADIMIVDSGAISLHGEEEEPEEDVDMGDLFGGGDDDY